MEKIRLAGEAGFAGVELWINDIYEHIGRGGEVSEIEKALDDHGLIVPCCIAIRQWGEMEGWEYKLILAEARRRADAAGLYRYPFPKAYGGREGTNLGMAVIREHLARQGLGLHNDLQNEHSVVGNNVGLLLMLHYGSEAQKAEWVDALATGTRGFAFGITEPGHGSDATHMETRAVRDGDHWVIDGEKTWNTGVHKASADLVFARTSGEAGDGRGITAFLVPRDTAGFEVQEYLWTFNMPTDHARFTLDGVWVPE